MEASKISFFGPPFKALYGLLAVISVLLITSISGNIYLFTTKGKPNNNQKDGETQKPQKEIEFRDSNLESFKSLLAKNQADGETAIMALTLMQNLDQAHIKSLEPYFQTSDETKRLFTVLEDAILNRNIKLITVIDANFDPVSFQLLTDSGLNDFFKIY
jgi:hypothetical protein